tara:strand:- start:455 stop:2152 length:1698 start_codon:yes stop_codon:yes gene_type:complete
MELRDYQNDSINNIRSAISSGSKAPLLVLPTGAGKTVIFSEIAKRCIKNDANVLVLVHRRELIKQASNKLKNIGVDHGIIAAKFPESNHNVQVASVQTLIRRKNNPFVPQLIIIDEAHHVAAGNTWSKILDRFPQAIRIGCTATPERLDGKGLGECFSELVIGTKIPELVEKGYLAPHIVFAAPNDLDLTKVRTIAGDYDPKELELRTEQADIVGDAVEMYRKHADGKPAIAFCISVKHAVATAKTFNEAGYKAAVIEGSMKTQDRDDVLEGLANGSIQVLCSCNVVSEGTDIPNVEVGILLRKTKSTGMYMQQVGRILRPLPNKVAIVLDHVGNTEEHGFVDEHREWSLDSKKRSKRGLTAPAVQTCPVCFATFRPARVCPVCGHVLINPKQLTHSDDELKRVVRDLNLTFGDKFIDTSSTETFIFICYADDFTMLPFSLDPEVPQGVVGIKEADLKRISKHLKVQGVNIYTKPTIKKLLSNDRQAFKTIRLQDVYSFKARSRSKNKKREVANARTYQELKAIEKERGYKKGWAWATLQSRKRKTWNRLVNWDTLEASNKMWNW